MDLDMVRLSLVLGPPDDAKHEYSDPMWRWEARCYMRGFAWNPDTKEPDLWKGKPVMRALIVP